MKFKELDQLDDYMLISITLNERANKLHPYSPLGMRLKTIANKYYNKSINEQVKKGNQK